MPKVIHQKSKKPLYIIYSLLFVSILSLVFINSTYADNVDYSVVVEPVLNITTSGDTEGVVSLDLNPETKAFDSKNLTVTVGTNNETGYKLYVNTTGDTTNLVEKNDSNLYIQTLADNGTTGYTENTFTANRWGYKLNTQNYFPFVSGALVNSSNVATAGVSSTLTFGAKANYDTKAGSYALALNFQAAANPLIYEMQNLNSMICTNTPMVVVDNRDEQEYVIQRLDDGNCWMMSNLNLGATSLIKNLTNENTNISTSISANTFNGWKKDAGSVDYTNAEYVSVPGTDSTSDTAYGVLYNFCALSGRTVCMSSSTNTSNAQYDLCPAGWRLPTKTEFDNLITYYNNNSKIRASILSGGAAFSLSGGLYRKTPEYVGYWAMYWSSTAVNTTYWKLEIDGGSTLQVVSRNGRGDGYSARCVKK